MILIRHRRSKTVSAAIAPLNGDASFTPPPVGGGAELEVLRRSTQYQPRQRIAETQVGVTVHPKGEAAVPSPPSSSPPSVIEVSLLLSLCLICTDGTYRSVSPLGGSLLARLIETVASDRQMLGPLVRRPIHVENFARMYASGKFIVLRRRDEAIVMTAVTNLSLTSEMAMGRVFDSSGTEREYGELEKEFQENVANFRSRLPCEYAKKAIHEEQNLGSRVLPYDHSLVRVSLSS